MGVATAGAGTRARIDRGTLGVAAVHVTSASDAARMSALEATGRLGRFKGFRQWEPAELEVQADRPVAVGVDGEAMLFDPPLVFRTRPAAVRVRVPVHSPGRSPAARAVGLTVANVKRLWDVARGHGALTADVPAGEA